MIGGVDYTSISNVSLVLSGQVSSVRVDIELREDSLLEGLEVFRVALQLMNQGLNGITFDSQTKDISIADNDSMLKKLIEKNTFKILIFFRSNDWISCSVT